MENSLDFKWAYHVMGADHTDTAQSLKDRYRILVKKWHPDQFANDPVMRERAEKEMQQINSAYQMVRNAPLRFYTPPKEPQRETPWENSGQAESYTPRSSGRKPRRKRSAAEATRERRRTAAFFRFFWGAMFGLLIAAYINTAAKLPDHEWEFAIWILAPLIFGWLNKNNRDNSVGEFSVWFLWW